MNYYNENDLFAAQWIRELITGGLIPPGDVDDRDIRSVKPTELRGYTQCHFFAGIAGWPLALRLAGWPEDRPVWTGSCPCQPFSVAGKRRGIRDARHLWPVWLRLIAECNGLYGVPVVFGEQIASNLGREWLVGVRASLQTLGYAVGASDICAASVGAPHIRQRLFWVANSTGDRRERFPSAAEQARRTLIEFRGPANRLVQSNSIASGCSVGGLGNSESNEQRRDSMPGQNRERESIGGSGSASWSDYETIPCADGKARRVKSGIQCLANGVPNRVAKLRGFGNAINPQAAAVFIRAAAETITQPTISHSGENAALKTR